MKLLVTVKQVKLFDDEVEMLADERDADPEYLEGSLNEWDAYALEEALRLRDTYGGEVCVVTAGKADAEETLRRCLAMGADRALRITRETIAPISTARMLASVARDFAPDLVFCGVQSADSVHGSTGTALAEFLDLPRVAAVIGLEWCPPDRQSFTES